MRYCIRLFGPELSRSFRQTMKRARSMLPAPIGQKSAARTSELTPATSSQSPKQYSSSAALQRRFELETSWMRESESQTGPKAFPVISLPHYPSNLHCSRHIQHCHPSPSFARNLQLVRIPGVVEVARHDEIPRTKPDALFKVLRHFRFCSFRMIRTGNGTTFLKSSKMSSVASLTRRRRLRARLEDAFARRYYQAVPLDTGRRCTCTELQMRGKVIVIWILHQQARDQ